MSILEAIELRLLRYANSINGQSHFLETTRKVAEEILNLTTENMNNMKAEVPRG